MSEKQDNQQNPKKERKRKSRADYEVVDIQIYEAFGELLKKGKRPTIGAVAKICKCDEKTVRRHLEEKSFAERFIAMRAFTEQVNFKLLQTILKTGDPKAMLLWYRVFENLDDKSRMNVTVSSDNNSKITLKDGTDIEL